MTRAPRPGQPVRGSQTGRPIMALFDLVGRRGSLAVLWSLHQAPQTFRALQDSTGGMAASTLNTRLRELRDAGLVERGDDGYALSAQGAELISLGLPLREWAETWAAGLSER